MNADIKFLVELTFKRPDRLKGEFLKTEYENLEIKVIPRIGDQKFQEELLQFNSNVISLLIRIPKNSEYR